MQCVILAPHQDDEVILCGSIMGWIKDLGNEIYIVFMTNGDYDHAVHDVRLKESLEVAELYEIDDNHVIFMGYANEYDPQDCHIYNSPAGHIVRSQYGNAVTYGLPEHPEYCFAKHGVHHDYTRENIYNDLYEIIDDIRPDLIFATGEEVHPDHSANSLLLDEVLGNIMRDDSDYRPVVLKKPEYHTAWIGEEDYSEVNNPSAKFDNRNRRTTVNGASAWFFDPYIRWSDRLRLPIDRAARENVEKALKIYKSQDAISHFTMLLNSDVVFWQRRTDSLTYASIITASSGNASFLNDFKRNDSSDIRRRETEVWNQNASIWRPVEGDNEPKIRIEFDGKYDIGNIVIYQEYNPLSVVNDCAVFADGYGEVWQGSLRRYKETSIRVPIIKTNAIDIRITNSTGRMSEIGISEIEVYTEHSHRDRFLKLMVDEQFVYEYVISQNIRQHLSVYVVNDIGESRVMSMDGFQIELSDENGGIISRDVIFDKNWNIITTALEGGSVRVKVVNNSNLSDQIELIFPQSEKKGKVYFIGTPNHWNSGDHFIAQATHDFIKEVLPKREICEVQINEFEDKLPQLKDDITRNDLIIMQGGGNMGNVYPTNEAIRRKVFSVFPYNRIIVFPETVYYEKTVDGEYDLETSCKIYSEAKNLTICARETESYNQMKRLYPNIRVLLTPDIVCSMNFETVPDTVREGASLFLRNDGEKAIQEDYLNCILSTLDQMELSYRYRDMIYHNNRGYSGKANRKAIIREKLQEIQESRIVITDRLHAMILSVMTGTPCVVIHGYNHKIPSTYETWFRDIPYLRLISEKGEIEGAVDAVLRANSNKEMIVDVFRDCFDELAAALREEIGFE